MDQDIGEMLDHELWSIGQTAKQADKSSKDALNLARMALDTAESAQKNAAAGILKAGDTAWELEQLRRRVAALERCIAALTMPKPNLKPTLPGM